MKLKEMILHYRDHGQRVDEVLFQEVNNIIERVQKLEKQRAKWKGKHTILQKQFNKKGHKYSEVRRILHRTEKMLSLKTDRVQELEIELGQVNKRWSKDIDENKRYREAIEIVLDGGSLLETESETLRKSLEDNYEK